MEGQARSNQHGSLTDGSAILSLTFLVPCFLANKTTGCFPGCCTFLGCETGVSSDFIALLDALALSNTAFTAPSVKHNVTPVLLQR